MAYTTYTLTDLKALLAAKYDASPFWTADEATIGLNEGLRLWNLLVGQWRRQVTLQTAARTYDYALPASMLYRTRIAWNGLPMKVTSLTSLDRGRRRWMTELSTDGGDVPSRPYLWAPVSLYTVRIWPADAVAHNSLTVDGVSETPVLVSNADTLDLGDELLGHLLGYALHAVSFKRGMPAISSTLPLFQSFLAAAALQNSMITSSQVYRKFMGLDRQREQVPLVQAAPPATGGAAQ